MVRIDGKIARLAKVDLFKGYSKRDLWRVASAVEEMVIDQGRVLSRQGERARACFLFIDGTGTVEVDGIAIGRVWPGDCVGHTALHDGLPFASTVTTCAGAFIYMFQRDGFRMLTETVPTFAPRLGLSAQF